MQTGTGNPGGCPFSFQVDAYQPVAKVVTAFDRPCIPADGVAIREGDHKGRPYMHPNRALSGGRRNGLGARGTFATGCYHREAASAVVRGDFEHGRIVN